MDRETLKKAKKLEDLIGNCDSLLESKRDTYYWCEITVNCGNSNGDYDKYGMIPRDIWDKMLDVLKIERDKLDEELNRL